MKKKFFMFLAFGFAAVSILYWINVSAAAGPASDDWWDAEWHYRIRVDVTSGRYFRQDEPVEFAIDIAAQLAFWDIPETLDVNSIRVIDQTRSGREVLSQYDPSSCEVIWLSGVMEKNTTKTFYVYFDTLENGSKPLPDYYESGEEGGIRILPAEDHLSVLYKIGGIEYEVARVDKLMGHLTFYKPPFGRVLIDDTGSGIELRTRDGCRVEDLYQVGGKEEGGSFALSGGQVRSSITFSSPSGDPEKGIGSLEKTYTFYFSPNGYDVRSKLAHEYAVMPEFSAPLNWEERQTSVEMNGARTGDFDTVFLAAGEDAAAFYDVSGSGTGLELYGLNTPPILSDNYWGAYGKRGGMAVIHSDPECAAWRLAGSESDSDWCWAAANSPHLNIPEQGMYDWAVWIYGYDENDWIAARDFGNRVQAPVTLKAEFAQHAFSPEDSPWQDLPDIPLHTKSYPLTRVEDNLITIDRGKGGLKVAWFNSSWAYRKSHVLGGSTVGQLTDYAVRFVVHYGSGTDSGEDVYLNSSCRADFGDVRFTNSADSLLDYWIENKTDGVSAVFWVEIDSIPASPGSSTFYIYYGNAAVVGVGDGKATFDWFDNFSLDSSVDYEIGRHTTVWHGLGAYNPYYDAVNQRVAYDTGDNFSGGWKVLSSNLLIQNFAAKVTFGVTGSYPINTTNGILGRWNGDAAYYGFYVAGGNYTAPALVRDARTTVIASPAGNSYHLFGGTPHTAELRLFGSSLEGIYNEGQADEVILTATDGAHAGAGQVEVIIAQATGWFDVFFVRKYVVPEPSHGAWGSEEGVPSYLKVTGSAAMDAGTSNELTITAYDQFDNVATSYSGLKNLTFSGPGIAPDGTAPTVEGTNIGGATIVNFTNGVSDANAATLIAYLAETTTVDVSDGTIDSSGDPSYDLDLLVNPGVPDNLIFGQQPTDAAAAAVIAPPATVEVRDSWNNVCTSDNTTSVVLAINNNPGGGTLSGTTTRVAVAGVATFDDLSIDRVGNGYTLDANSSGLTGATSAPFDISVGTAARVVIEDAADGSGAEVTTRALSSGQSFMVYAITRDGADNFVANEAVTWSLINMTGGVVSGDLVAAGDNRSATFTANAGGTAQINAVHATLGSDATGVVTVSAGTAARVVIEDAADGSGAEVTTRALSSGQSFTVYAITRDGADNFVANEAVTWSLINMTGGVVSGDLVAAGDNRSATFTANAGGTARISAAHAGLGTDTTGAITVRNRPPVAVAGDDTFVILGETVSLDGSASYDPDGDRLTFRWVFLNKPPDSNAEISDGQSDRCSFVADTWGKFTIRLIVNDGVEDSQPDDVRVQVRAHPVALFEFTPVSGLIPLAVSFDASASYDPDGRIISYLWDFGDGTTGQGIKPRHTYTAVGEYSIVLKVTDNDGLTDSETKSVLAKTLHPPLNVSLKREINRSLFKQEAFHTIRWSANPENGGLNIVGYRIYRKDAQAGDESYQLLNTLSGSTLSYVDGFLDVEKKYVYVVTAVEASGRESGMSFPVVN